MPNMPLWAQYILAVAGLVTATLLLWTKLIRPLANLITLIGQILPLMKELTKAFQDSPGAFKVLEEIAGEFKANSGSSLRDVVDRLDKAADDNRNAAEFLKIGVETQKQLAEQDRAHMQRFMILLDRLAIKVEDTTDITKGLQLQVDDAAKVSKDE